MSKAIKEAEKILKQYYGYDHFREGQIPVIEAVLEGRDVLGIMPTGAGKSVCYQVPALMMKGITIVISPLISLMKDQVGTLNQMGVHAAFLNSSLTSGQYYKALQLAKQGRYKIIYVAPERLETESFLDFAFSEQVQISFVAVDEAHCVSQWGQDFRPGYLKILDFLDRLSYRPVVGAYTATATAEVREDILDILRLQNPYVETTGFDRGNLFFAVKKPVDKYKELISYLKEKGYDTSGDSGIIYCLTRKSVEQVSFDLRNEGFSVTRYHAGLSDEERKENQENFIYGKRQIMVATNAFGMGIDKPDVRFVIHYDIPRSLEGYYQETGRAGRDGKEGVCIAYYSYKDIRKLDKFLQSKPVAEQEIGRQLLMETLAYAESGECRRKLLLSYFGEDYPKDNCGACDNCLNPRPKFDARKEMALAIELVKSLPEHFKVEHLANVLTGVANGMIKSYKHDKLKFFGAGSDHTVRFWEMILHQGLIKHFLGRDIDSYGLLTVTEEGLKFAEKPYELMLSGDRNFSESTDDEDDDDTPVPAKGGQGGDQVLLSMLKDLRRSEAKKLHLQPWVIFSDVSLDDMSIMYPETLDELIKCQSVGEGKARKYGKPFIELITRYVEENEISRPDDFVVRSMPNKSSDKIFIITSIDRRMDLEDIADARNMDMNELLSAMEDIVEFGTRLNLDYYIDQNIDADVVDEIYEYFKDEAESGSLEDAIQALGGDYEEMEIRLVRLKFMSEVAN